ncbi:MAG: hypothetical protein ACE5EG_00200 [Thermoanaerobaculia bacterium]
MNRAFLRIAPLAILILALHALPATAQSERPTHLIQISLLAAAKSGPNELADLPQNTRQAIEDVRQFLPFKSYRLLDTALMRTDRVARTMLTGPDNREFRAELSLAPSGSELMVRHFELVEKVELPAPLIAGGGDTGGPVSPASKQVLSSSFAAAIGQTVVVGTSRLNGGDEALVVLFTALP